MFFMKFSPTSAIVLWIAALAPFALAEDSPTLSSDEAFTPRVTMNPDSNRIDAKWSIADGYYMYKSKFEISVVSGDHVKLGKVDFPNGEIKNDKYFGTQEVYHDSVAFPIPILASDSGKFTVQVKFQGCAEKGVCFPPKRIRYQFPVTKINAPDGDSRGGLTTVSASTVQPSTADTAVSNTEESRLTALLKSGHFLTIVGVFFLGGLALTFTPCVLPMIPILSSIIVGQKKALRKSECFALSLSYVIGMATTYAILGLVLGMAGNNVIAYLQNPWVIVAFAGLFVLLSLSMFGLYELRLPQAIQSRLDNLSNKQRGGTYIGTLVMGVLSALVVSPCVSAPLAGALVYISTTEGGAALGGTALFSLGMGMGTPLLIIGTGGAHLIPRAGAWMIGVKAFFGVMLLGVAIWFLDRIIPSTYTLALWGALLLGAGVYLGGLDFGAKQGWAQIRKATGFLSVLYGSLMWVGAASGSSDPFQPLSFPNLASSRSAISASDINEQFITVSNMEQLENQLSLAKSRGQPVMLDFFAEWCVSCVTMEREVFPEPSVSQRLEVFHLIRADVTDDSTLLEHYNLFGPPSLLFFDDSGRELKQLHVRSEIHAQELATHLDTIIPVALPKPAETGNTLALSEKYGDTTL